MTRRPKGKRPPRLDLPPPPRAPARLQPRTVGVRRRLLAARLAGVVSPFGRAELSSQVAGIVAGNVEATLGLDLADPGRGRPRREEVWDALTEGWGVDGSGPTVTIAVERTIGAADLAAARLAEVCARGGAVALATARPASMLWCYQELARRLEAAGATVLRSNAPGRPGPGAPRRPRHVWWLGGVAVVTDGRSILADDGAGLTDDWLFGVGRPDLVVADRGFAAAAVSCGHPTVAPADLDAMALEVAARRGAPVVTVPLDCSLPPEAYLPLVELLGARLPVAGLEPGPATGPLRPPRPPHSTTPPPGAYAAPESGGEG